jgi:thioredoxin reductase
MRVERADVVVVGGGPAGLAAATELRRRGVDSVVVLEREAEAGGIPRHCAHPGFGLRDLRRVYSGPGYARAWVRTAQRAGVELRTGATVTGWTGERELSVTSPRGLAVVRADAVVLATGCRERPRPARLVPGSRPAGVLTTGQLQRLLHPAATGDVGRRAVVVGAEHVSFSALLTLAGAGVEVAALVTDLPRHQTYAAFRTAAALRWRTPLLTRTRISRIVGHGRVTAVEFTHVDTGAVRTLACDTVVFTGDWIPDSELARRGGVDVDPATRGPLVDSAQTTSLPGVFAAGNLVHPAEIADVAALGGRAAAGGVCAWLAGSAVGAPVRIEVDAPVDWITPQLLVPGCPPPRFALRASVVTGPGRLEVRQDGRVLASRRVRRLVPNRAVHLGTGWVGELSPTAGPAVVSFVSG